MGSMSWDVRPLVAKCVLWEVEKLHHNISNVIVIARI